MINIDHEAEIGYNYFNFRARKYNFSIIFYSNTIVFLKKFYFLQLVAYMSKNTLLYYGTDARITPKGSRNPETKENLVSSHRNGINSCIR